MKKVEVEQRDDYVKPDGEELAKVTEIEDTPFTVVRVDDKYFLALGRWRLCEPVESEEEARAEADDMSWNRLLSIMTAVAEEVYFEKYVEKNMTDEKTKEKGSGEGKAKAKQ